MQVKATINMSYEDKKTAEKIRQALIIDDETFISSKIIKNKIHADIESDSLSSFLQTIDDYLSCLSVAEKIIETKEKIKK